MQVDLLCLGSGKASTHIYHGEPSTGFVVLQNNEPVVLLGAGLGIVRSCMHYCKQIPGTIYISHNHSDHAGELPLLLSVEAGKGRRKKVVAEPEVMARILSSRLAEYHESISLSNRKLTDLAEFIDAPEGEVTHLTDRLSIIPHRSQHSERCFGFVLYFGNQPILGWSADSGYDQRFYSLICTAPVAILDARVTGSYDHASFENVIEYERELAVASDNNSEQRVAIYVTAYGTQSEAPSVPQALRIGQTLVLFHDAACPPDPPGPPPLATHRSHPMLHPLSAPNPAPAAPPPPSAHPPHPHPAHPQSPPPHEPPPPQQQQHPYPDYPVTPQNRRSHSGGAGPGMRTRGRSTSPTARRSSSVLSTQQQRSNEIRNLLHQMHSESLGGRGDGTERPSSHELYGGGPPSVQYNDRAYSFPLPGQVGGSNSRLATHSSQQSHEPHSIRKFPNPVPGPTKVTVFNNENKGAPGKMFLIKNVRTLDQFKLRVADSLNIKPIKHIYTVDGHIVKNLNELSHAQDLVATKHAGAPFDIHDLPLQIKLPSGNAGVQGRQHPHAYG